MFEVATLCSDASCLSLTGSSTSCGFHSKRTQIHGRSQRGEILEGCNYCAIDQKLSWTRKGNYFA